MRKTQRGSAMLFALIMTVAITSVVVATANLTMESIRVERFRETEAMARAVMDAANAKKQSESKDGSLIFGSPDTVTAGSNTANITTNDNSGSIMGSLITDTTSVVNAKNYNGGIVMGNRKTPKPNYYALFSHDAFTMNGGDDLVTGSGGVNGDVCANGDITLTNGSTINGDIESTGSVPANCTVTGTRLSSASHVPFPALNGADYHPLYNTEYHGDQTWNGWVFISAYRLIYIHGDLSIKGVIMGTGTVYVEGNVDITNDMSYFNAASKIAIITEGNLDWSNSAGNAVGYYYVAGTASTSGGSARTLTRGTIAARAVDFDADVTILGDSNIWTIPTEGASLKLPGFWP